MIIFPLPRSWYDDDVAAPKFDVLLQVTAARDGAVIKSHRFLLGRRAAQDDDVVERSECGRPARHAKRLHHIHAWIDDELTGLVDLPDDINLVTTDIAY
jgi:hypothetical protein